MDQTHNGKIAKPEMAAMSGAMSKADREALVKLVRRAERAHKTLAEQRKAEQLADFERQLAAGHKYSDDEVWEEAHAEASRVVAEADTKIAERCRELGIRCSPAVLGMCPGSCCQRGPRASVRARSGSEAPCGQRCDAKTSRERIPFAAEPEPETKKAPGRRRKGK